MNPEDQLNQKIAQDKYARGICGTASAQVGYSDVCVNQSYRPSLREEAEKAMGYHFEEAQKKQAAATFLRDHPEFDEFIRLIRSGSISI